MNKLSLARHCIELDVKSRVHLYLPHFFQLFQVDLNSLLLILLFSVVSLIVGFADLNYFGFIYLGWQVFHFWGVWLTNVCFFLWILFLFLNWLDYFNNFLVSHNLDLSWVSNRISFKISILENIVNFFSKLEKILFAVVINL